MENFAQMHAFYTFGFWISSVIEIVCLLDSPSGPELKYNIFWSDLQDHSQNTVPFVLTFRITVGRPGDFPVFCTQRKPVE